MADVDLKALFPNMTPVKGPPPLFTINGCGVSLYGSRDADERTGTYIATLCAVVVFFPVMCLRSYRVAKAPTGGWYFIGREPMSGVAKGWNLLLVLGIAAAIGGVRYQAYTTSPAYLAARQMERAKASADAGRVGEAAKSYHALAGTGGPQSAEAAAAVAGLLDGPCATAPLADAADAYAAAAQLARRNQLVVAGASTTPAAVADKGLKLAAARGDADPKGGIALLDVVRPLVIDPRAVDARRLALLRKWAKAEPANLAAVVPLAALLADDDKTAAEAKALLMPVKDQLGDGEGARVLGTILGREGDQDGAYALLWPYVKARLDRLHAAEKNVESVGERISSREIDLLNNDKGPADFYDKYKAATGNKDAQGALVREYVGGRVKADPELTEAQAALERETGVVPVALELGIVMLQRAQGQKDADARKTQLEATEQVFLAVGGVAGESDAYRISLGQVYYWLGKQAEGRKLFDEYLASKKRGAKDLLAVAGKLRHLGATAEARAMGEEAYAAAGSDADVRHYAAEFRAACFKDVDDQIAWLSKANPADPRVRSDLAKARGEKALEDGRDDEAATQFRAAIDAYVAMPRTATSVNDSALAQYGLFRATGDRAALDRCVDLFQQAVELEPADAILLFNAGDTLLDGSIADVIGPALDLRALRSVGGVGMLGYLYADQAGRDAWAARVRTHPGVAKAMAMLEKVAVLSPKHERAFTALYSVHRFTQDEAALRSLEQRARAAEIDPADQIAAAKEYLDGTKDPQRVAALTAAVTKGRDRLAAGRAAGGATAAAALDRQAEALLALGTFTGSPDVDQVLALAAEADRLATSSQTRGTLETAYLARAARQLRSADRAFDAHVRKYERSVGLAYVMAACASDPGPFHDAVLAHPDVRRAAALVREDADRYRNGHSAYEWALVRNIDPAAGVAAADTLRTVSRKRLERSIEALLRPMSADEALEAYWTAQAVGRPEEGRAALAKVVAAGVPVPVQP